MPQCADDARNQKINLHIRCKFPLPCPARLLILWRSKKRQTTNRRKRHMKMTLTTSQIADQLKRDDNAGWSYAGAYALAEYLELVEEDTGEEMELDVVAIRCDFSEHSSLKDWAVDYFGGEDKAAAEFDCEPSELEDCEDKIRDYINDNGQLIEFSGGIIVSSF